MDIKKITPHLLVAGIFIVLAYFFFLPLLSGKDLQQSDMMNAAGMRQELVKYEEQSGELSMWTNAMFSGMPSYQIYKGGSPYNVFGFMQKVIRFGLPYNSVGIIFASLICFYILLLTLRCNPWLAMAGAVAYTFASYNLIIIEVGHITKAYAIAYFPLTIAGLLLLFREKLGWGLLLITLGLGLEISANHPQITYYLALTVLVFFMVELVGAIREKNVGGYFKKAAIFALGGLLAVLPNITSLWTTYEYGKESLRGKSELAPKAGEKESSGLDREYAFGWSYGVAETGTLAIPNFMGGSNNESLDKNSNTYKVLQQNGVPNADEIIKHLPMYWGDQPFTSGPVYIGALVVFLFVLGIFLVEGPVKWWLVAATVLSLVLSWGKNFAAINDLFFYYFPMYNKFRAVSMTLVIAGFTVPLLGFLALQKIFSGEAGKEQIQKALMKSLYIVGGFLAVFIVLPGMFFNFSSPGDQQMMQSGYPDWLMAAIRQDRESMLRTDAIRSLVFVGIGAGLIWALLKDKIKPVLASCVLALVLLIDLGMVDKRYLSEDDFVPKTDATTPYRPTAADEQILKDTDPNFRVFNVTVSPFNDASTSYFHKSIGGYHGAKLRRYQELWDAHISQNNMAVINMLNTRYFIVPGPDKAPMAQRNPGALGNAWFVKTVKQVDNADAELAALDTSARFDPLTVAVVDKRFSDKLTGFAPFTGNDSTGTDAIKLTSYKPNHLTYESVASTGRLAVFSEIYYDKGWNAFIDGKPADHFRANYVLRALLVPAGKHTVEFKFEPQSYYTANKISLAASLVVLLLAAGVIYTEIRRKNSQPVAAEPVKKKSK